MKVMINIDNLNGNWFVCLIWSSGPKALLQILALYWVLRRISFHLQALNDRKDLWGHLIRLLGRYSHLD